MTDIDKNKDVVTADLAPSTSERLRSAREEKKITIAEVAAQLRLPRNTIKSLEDGQWQELSGRAYARGYFLNYVKLLGLPRDVLLGAFKYKISEPTVTINQQQTIKKKSPSLRLLFLIVAISFVVLFCYQQWQYHSDKAINRTESLPTNQDVELIDSFRSSTVEPLSEIININNEQSLVDAEKIMLEQMLDTGPDTQGKVARVSLGVGF